MDLNDYRAQIDKIDNDLLQLFKERMDVCRHIALYKKEHGLPVLNAERERELLITIENKSEEFLRPYTLKLYTTLLELSRDYQKGIFL